jgi:hypothetical protein
MPESATDTAPATDDAATADDAPDTGAEDTAAATEDTTPEPAKPDTDTAPKNDDSSAGDLAKLLAAAQADVAKWKAAARKHEDRAKANAGAATELEELRRQALSDQERAVVDAKAEGRREVLREVGLKLVAAEFRAAAAKHSIDDDTLSTLTEMVDMGRYLDDDGEVKVDDIASHLARFAPKPQPAPEPEKKDEPAAADTAKQQGVPDLGQGVRNAGGKPVPGLNEDALTRDLERVLGMRR